MTGFFCQRHFRLELLREPMQWATECSQGQVRAALGKAVGRKPTQWATEELKLLAQANPLSANPGLADSPWATRCRPLRGLTLIHRIPTNPWTDWINFSES